MYNTFNRSLTNKEMHERARILAMGSDITEMGRKINETMIYQRIKEAQQQRIKDLKHPRILGSDKSF